MRKVWMYIDGPNFYYSINKLPLAKSRLTTSGYPETGGPHVPETAIPAAHPRQHTLRRRADLPAQSSDAPSG